MRQTNNNKLHLILFIVVFGDHLVLLGHIQHLTYDPNAVGFWNPIDTKVDDYAAKLVEKEPWRRSGRPDARRGQIPKTVHDEVRQDEAGRARAG